MSVFFLSLIDRPGFNRWLNLALALVAAGQLAVCAAGDSGSFWLLSLWLLSLLICIVMAKFVHQARKDRRASYSQEQMGAMVSMLRDIKHKLDNDMQVVLGNSELAQILINGKGNPLKPVLNIAAAANDAVERIEELSVLVSIESTNPEPFNLNSMVRRKMARLAGEMPPLVNLRLELESLSSRAIADRHLLNLSLSNLVRQMAKNLQYGGEIVVKVGQDAITAERSQPTVHAEVSAASTINHTLSKEDTSSLHDCLISSKALVERSGANKVHFSHTDNGCLFSMSFMPELLKDVHKNARLLSEMGHQFSGHTD